MYDDNVSQQPPLFSICYGLVDQPLAPGDVLPCARNDIDLARFQGFGNIAELLLDRGLAINSQTQEGYTPLYLASQGGSIEVAKLVLSYPGAQQSLNLVDEEGWTALQVHKS